MPLQENPTPPNLVFYEVLTGTLDTGIQVMVQLFRQPDGKITLAQVAFRKDSWERWGVPVRLQQMGTYDTTTGQPA